MGDIHEVFTTFALSQTRMIATVSGEVTVTSETVTVPANGAKLYVRLEQKINGVWRTTDYAYLAYTAP